jgi:hypothetical protein
MLSHPPGVVLANTALPALEYGERLKIRKTTLLAFVYFGHQMPIQR